MMLIYGADIVITVKLYRAEVTLIPRNDNLIHGYNTSIYFDSFNVVRETPKGFWINIDQCEKWVSSEAVKRFAYPTKEEALHNLKKRTELRIKILATQTDKSRSILDKINEIS